MDIPSPQYVLSYEELQRLKDILKECIPIDSMIVDLWDWDVHFENSLEDDWYFEAVFGSSDKQEACARELADFFLEQVEDLGMEYNQHEDYELFLGIVAGEARQFIQGWRDNIFNRFVQLEDEANSKI
jgi:hypothetical protein